MTPERHSTSPLDPDESAATVQLLVADPGNKSAISDMLDEDFVVETSETVTDADLYLIEDHLFPEYRTAVRERVEQEDPVFCPIVLIRRERTNLRQAGGDPSPGDQAAPYDEVVDAPIDPKLLIRRLNSLLVRRHQSQELMQQVSTLENREQRLRRFEHGIEATGNGIVMTDSGGTIEYANPAFEAISGYSTDELLGESPQLLLPEGSGEFFDTEFRGTLAEQGEWEGDIIIERKNSQRRVINAKATALRDTERETEGFVLVLSDITERIGRERELEDREEQLDLLRQIMTRYLRHNIRNDLNAIVGNAQLLKEDETLSAEHIAFAETIIDTANDLMEKSETARTYSQLLDHETELSAFDLSATVTEAVETAREHYPDVTFDIDVPGTSEIWAREGLQRAIEELIDNAARYNDATDSLVRVQVRDRDGARVVIEDNGPGISDQELESLQRGTETQLSHSQGMGLWLSNWLIESINGHLSIETTDSGTRITVELPPPESVGSGSLEVTTLKERERRLEAITDRMTDGTLNVDANWEITRLDERAEGILDVTWDTVVGKSLWDVFPDLRETRFETAVQDAMESRSRTSVEEYFAPMDTWLMMDVYPEFDGGLSIYIQDVTQRVQRKKTLEETKGRLEAIIDLSPEPIVGINASGAVFLWNEAAEDVFGHEAADVIGEGLQSLDLFNQEQSDRFNARLERVLAGETIRGLEVERQRKDGSTVHLSISATPLNEAPGEGTGMLAVAQDITPLIEREQQHSDLKQRYQTMIEAAPDPIFVADAETGEIIEVNEAAERLLGESREDIIGRHQSDLHPPEKIEQYRQSFEKYVGESGTTRTLPDGSQTFVAKRDGEQVPVEISVDTVSLSEGTVLFGIFRDISEQIEREAELRRELEFRRLHSVVDHELPQAETSEAVSHRVTDIVAGSELFGCTFVALVDQESPSFVCGTESDLDDPDIDRIHSEEYVKRVIESGIYHMGDVTETPFQQHFDNSVPSHEGLGIEIAYNNETYGVLTVHLPPGKMVSEEEVEYLTDVADDVARFHYIIDIEPDVRD